jgi:hypothetical protein
MIERDEDGQLQEPWEEVDFQLLEILEEISTDRINPDKTLAAYMADIKELLEGEL